MAESKRKPAARRKRATGSSSSAAARARDRAKAREAADADTGGDVERVRAKAGELEIVRFGDHTSSCRAVAGEVEPAWICYPIATLLDDGRTALLIRCNDALCSAALAWPFSSAVGILERSVPDLAGVRLPEQIEAEERQIHEAVPAAADVLEVLPQAGGEPLADAVEGDPDKAAETEAGAS